MLGGCRVGSGCGEFRPCLVSSCGGWIDWAAGSGQWVLGWVLLWQRVLNFHSDRFAAHAWEACSLGL